ncbi:MAG: hypothetical protein COX90_02480 [Candidatus Nealsonbacteria bacterium CG_4_10_14_0_2_um_filter_38_17]|uniref:Uncharacterized protein n=1 Tax=Candidatus Nealsonbacteria bacterium CG_4_10_14_0_2_um_filter_38_17 TaxID=1974680 RepID=A0A2M7UXZ1_9BACT|nr:MAG: hypothetical protein COX90_02480 [Candidatus Nealsonbacteria bacterium CG_4_10_14_0_2_um_filter_38_17]
MTSSGVNDLLTNPLDRLRWKNCGLLEDKFGRKRDFMGFFLKCPKSSILRLDKKTKLFKLRIEGVRDLIL